MPKAGTCQIGTVIPSILRQATQTQGALRRVQACWKEVAGDPLARQAKPTKMYRGTLYLSTEQPGVTFLIGLEQPRLLERLRDRLQDGLGAQHPIEIREIVVRIGTGRPR